MSLFCFVTPTSKLKVCAALTLVCLAVSERAGAQVQYRPADFAGGSLPPGASPMVAGGGEVALEVAVAADGSVTNVTVLRTTPPYTDALVGAVRGWRFKPAERLLPARAASAPPAWQPVAGKVLVAEVVTAPALLGPTLGELPKDMARESDDSPSPLSMPGPRFPASARDEGTVLVRAAIGLDGRVTDARAIRSAGALDSSALEAARAWSFRPPRLDGFSVPSVAFLVFGFRQPVLTR